VTEMDEEKGYIQRDPNMTKLARELSSFSRGAGIVGFSIKYSATEGNLKIHEAFQKFAFDEANNEYLVAIDKLLNNAKFIDYFRVLDERITRLENKEDVVEEKEEKADDMPKTF
jgi:hypothetical protein